MLKLTLDIILVFSIQCVIFILYQSGPRSKSGTVELTPLSYIPGGRIDTYLGHLNFFIIRETTSVREVSVLHVRPD